MLTLKHLDPKALKPAGYNPRKIGEAERAALKRGVAEFGLIDPIVARSEDLLVLGGHQRLSVAIELGLAEVPVALIEGLSDDRAAAVNVLLNNPRAQGGWDMAALSSVLSELDANGFDATLTGFDEGELENILAWTPEPDKAGEEDPDVDLTPPAEPKSKLGEVYQLGRHRLMCGDSTAVTDVAKLLGGVKPSLVFTDPPYNVAFNGRSGRFEVIENDELPPEAFAAFLQEFVNTLYAVAPSAPWYICTNWKMFHVLRPMLPDLNACIVWAKNVFGMGNGYRHQHEWIAYVGPAIPRTDESDLWEIARESGRVYKHPTQKPPALPRRAIENSTKPRDVVLDLFGGSGPTLVACEQTGRTAYLMEHDPRYCDVIRNRYAALVGDTEAAA